VLENAGYGVYRAVATPRRAGNWSLGVTAEWPDGARRRAQQANALIVQAAFDASDGRRYVVRVATDPAQPAVRQPATVRAAFVDFATGAPLPDGATPPVGLPPKIEVAFFAQAGVTSVSLASVGHGVYEGQATLWSIETWTVRLSVTGPDGEDVTFEAGAVQAK
jgi:hypothetical protein